MVVADFAPCFGVKKSRENESIATIRLESDCCAEQFVHLQPTLDSPQLLTVSFCKMRMLRYFEIASRVSPAFATLRPGKQTHGYNNLDGNLVGPISGRAAIKAVTHPKTRLKSGPGIVAWFLQRYPPIAERLRLVRSRSQRRRSAIVDPLRPVQLAE
jgi:hypothetical protein